MSGLKSGKYVLPVETPIDSNLRKAILSQNGFHVETSSITSRKLQNTPRLKGTTCKYNQAKRAQNK